MIGLWLTLAISWYDPCEALPAGAPSGLLGSEYAEPAPMAPPVASLDTARADLLAALDRLDVFPGVFAQGSVAGGDSQRVGAVGVEWELFQDGLYESYRRLDRTRREAQIDLIQLLRDAQTRALDQRVYRLHASRNLVRFRSSQQRTVILDGVAARAAQALSEMLITVDEAAAWEARRAQAVDEAEIYASFDQARLPATELALANRVEHVEPQSHVWLTERAQAVSYDLELLHLLADQSHDLPTWLDNLEVRLFAEHQFEKEYADDDVLGLRVRVPIDFDLDRSNVARLQGQHYARQEKAARERLAERVRGARAAVVLAQSTIRSQQRELNLVQQRLRSACQRRAEPVSVLDDVPAKEADALALEMAGTESKLLELRLEALEALLDLASLVHIDDLATLMVR